ncbi:MAG: alpha/beta hydrolase [Chloroflexota bacterium]
MGSSILAEGITSQTVDTARLRVHYLNKGSGGEPIILVHGNLSSSLLWDETLAALPDRFHAMAIDMRGFGDTETKPVDATRGLSDFADDLRAFVEAMGISQPAHLIGHSTGGGVIMQYAVDHPADVASITLVAAVSPYGFGGTKDADGTPVFADYAGAGGGGIAPDLVTALNNNDMSEDSPMTPRNVMNAFYWKPPYRVASDREDAFVGAILKTAVGDQNFPGNATGSDNWPGFAPGDAGVNNALSGKYFNVSHIVDIDPKPPILWVHGTDDQVVADTSMFELGFLGQLGAIPGWPGSDVYPPQPMKQQMRSVLARYEANGGHIQEVEIADSGHSPFIDKFEDFRAALLGFLG